MFYLFIVQEPRVKFEKIHGYQQQKSFVSLHHPQSIEPVESCSNDLCKSMMINVLFFTFIKKCVVAMHCYWYCALVCIAELLTGENQNSKTWPTI